MEHKIEYIAEARVTTLPSGEEFLLVTVKIVCPICGTIEMEMPGHHLRALRNLFVEYVDLYPHLTNKQDELRVLARLNGPTPGSETQH